MTHDEKLIDAVARQMCERRYEGVGYSVWDESLSELDKEECRKDARAALDAINASGTHLIVDVETVDTIATRLGRTASKEQP